MSLVCFTSFKGSPGTTITALATAATWPTAEGRRKLLLEADPDGGSLALRYQLPTKPGLLSLAAATRHGLSPEQLWDHAQTLPGGLPVVLGPEGPEQATEVLRSNGRALGDWLKSLHGIDVIADLGRLSLGSAAFELARSADAVLAVARPEATQLQPAAQRLVTLGPYGPRVGWVLVGEKPYSAQAVTDAYGLPVVHVVAEDRRGARLMESGANPKKLRRSTLVRSVVGLSEALAAWLHPGAAPSTAPPTDDEVTGGVDAHAPTVVAPTAGEEIDADWSPPVPAPTTRSSEIGPEPTHREPPAPEPSPSDAVALPPPDAHRPPSLAILAARRSQHFAADENQNGNRPAGPISNGPVSNGSVSDGSEGRGDDRS